MNYSLSPSRFDMLYIRDSLLYIMSCYLSYWYLPISSKESDLSHRELVLTGYFIFFKLFSANPREHCLVKSQQVLK